jgi:hypothetical protein
MSHAATKPAATLAHPPAPIPFRQSGGVSGPEVFTSFGITLLLLGAAAAGAFYARRRGWLDRWLAVPTTADAGKRRLAVVERLALSRKTTLIRVRDGERELLVLESANGAQMMPTTGEGTTP